VGGEVWVVVFNNFFAQQFGFDGNRIGSANVFGGSSNEIGKGVIINADGTFVAVGQTTSNNGDVSGNHGQSDAWLVKFKF
jgi:hypothetical protein